MWKKRLVPLILAAAMLGACGGCGDKTSDSKSANADDSKFIVGFDAAFPPYGYQDDNGEYVGFDLDLAAEVCSRNNWELVKTPIDWDAKDMELNSGTISCIWNGFTMNGNEEGRLHMVREPYVWTTSQVFRWSRKRRRHCVVRWPRRKRLRCEYRLIPAAQAALDEDENADLKNSFKELLVVGDYNTAFMNLEAGAVDAIAMDIGVASYQLESRSGGFTILDEPLAAEQYAIGFKKGNTELRDKVQKTLDEMAADGTFEKDRRKMGSAGRRHTLGK
ncbi:MAG: transporter substrate-binding domain-containing protein [Ruminococcus sp.]